MKRHGMQPKALNPDYEPGRPGAGLVPEFRRMPPAGGDGVTAFGEQ